MWLSFRVRDLYYVQSKISFLTLLLKSVQLYILIITIFFFLTRLIELNISTETTDRNYNFVEACKTNERKEPFVGFSSWESSFVNSNINNSYSKSRRPFLILLCPPPHNLRITFHFCRIAHMLLFIRTRIVAACYYGRPPKIVDVEKCSGVFFFHHRAISQSSK